MSKILIAYYSRRGENYVSGDIRILERGNNEVIAEKIKQLLPEADLLHIDTVKPYAEDYNVCIEEAKAELRTQARPAMKSPLERIDQYDTIILGYPNWWGTMPMVVYTFLESYDFAGKTIIPFCSHEGSGMGVSERTIAQLAPTAKLIKGVSIQGSHAAHADREVREIVSKALSNQ